MGSGFTAACPHCGYKQDVHLGRDTELPDIWEVIAQLPAAHRTRVESILRSHPEAVFEWHRALCACTACHRRFNPKAASVTLRGKQVFHTVYQCPHCRESLVEIDVGDQSKAIEKGFAADWACQRCARRGLTITEDGLRD